MLPLILEQVYVNSPHFLTIFPQLTPRCKRLPNQILMHLFVSINLVPFALVIFHCLILYFPHTKEAQVFLILSLPGMSKLGLVIVFVIVVVNTLAVDLSVLLIPKQ